MRIETEYLKKIISDNDYKIDYGDTDNLQGLPNYVKLHEECNEYSLQIELHENSNEIFCEVWLKEVEVEVTDEQLDYIFYTFTTLLNNKIEHCKRLFYEHRINDIYQHMKKTKVYQKMFQLVGEFDTLKEAKELIKYIKTEEKIKTNKDFKIKQNE